MGPYEDMLSLSRPVFSRHPPMRRADRAKQFMPFAALKGYEEAIADKQVLYVPYKELDEEKRAALDRCLFRLRDALGQGRRPNVTLEYFIVNDDLMDSDETLGQYHTFAGSAEKLDLDGLTLRVSGRVFSLEDVTALQLADE